MNRLGIDIGSKTLKLMLLDADGNELYSSYEMHRGRVGEVLRESIHDVIWHLGDREVRIAVAGSSGMRVSELFGIPFVQEVVALKRAVLAQYPDADAILEMGGEDTKLVYLTGAPEQRMNNVCAGGTGSFIEMMSGLIGEQVQAIDRLAKGYTTIYPIASRCAVFAKSDVRPLMHAGARKEDVAASVLDAVCTQAIAGLSAGRPLSGTVLLLGGPFQHITSLRDAFCRVSGFDREHAIVPTDAHLFVARGAALSGRMSDPMMLSDFEQRLEQADFESESGIGRLRPLFESEEEYEEFRERHSRTRVPRVTWTNATNDLFLGIDAGSTTAKVALIDSTGALIGYDYRRHWGDVVGSLTKMMNSLLDRLGSKYTEKRVVRRSCAVGYGEQLCRTAFGIDDGEVETVAHLRAATAIDPEVDFLMDIGGQDVKCFYVKDGVIQDVVLNEACSSGCGSLFDSVAKSFNKGQRDFVGEALRAKAPVDLGTRCTTFMNSRIRYAQKEGATSEDIAAGVVYATARNALFKVVRQPDFSKVGKHVVVQGGAFGNDALLRAFELETGAQVSRPDLAPVMAAWGAALLARDAWLAQREADPEAAEQAVSGLVSIDEMLNMDVFKKVVRCDGCSNRCELRVARFALREEDATKRMLDGDYVAGTERILVTGNRCERGALMNGAHAEKHAAPPNLAKYKRALLASYAGGRRGAAAAGAADAADAAAGAAPAGAPASDRSADLRVGIPKALALYESYPFWKTFFDELGVEVVDCADPSDDVFKMGMACIPAEGMCYPSKAVYGQAVDLVRRGADILFAPYVSTGLAQLGLAGMPFDADLKTCPLVENMGAMLAGNAAGSPLEDARVVMPDLREAASIADICAPIADALSQVGMTYSLEDVERAVAAASQEYRSFIGKLEERTSKVLAAIERGEYPGVVLVGHAYHASEGVSHGVDELLGELGYAVVEWAGSGRGCAACAKNAEAERGFRWYENVSAADRIADCEGHAGLQPIIVRSFGCGIDALAADGLRDSLRASGSIYAELKMDQIADLATVRIRLRSLAYAHRQRAGQARLFDLTVPPEAYEEQAVRPIRYEQRERERWEEELRRNPGARKVFEGTPSWQEWEGQGKTATFALFNDAMHVSIVAPQGYLIEFDADVPENLPKPGVGGGHVGPNLSASRDPNDRPKPRRVPYAHKYLGLEKVAGETLKLGFSHAADPLNPDPSWEERGRPNTYAGATPPNYGPNYHKHTA